AALDDVKARFRARLDGILGYETAGRALSGNLQDALPLYRNVSGYARGGWVRSQAVRDVAAPTLNRTALASEAPFHRNITGGSGSIRLQLNERALEFLEERRGVKEVKAALVIHDEASSGDGWEFTLHGVHFAATGTMVLTTTSERFGGMFGLPHFMLSGAMFNASLGLLNDTLRTVIEEQAEDARIVTNPWTSTSDGGAEGLYPPPDCEYVVYIQQHPLSKSDPTTETPKDQHPLDEVEKELRYPSGYIHVPPPDMQMEAVIFSPDCGFVLESKGPPDYPPSEAQHLIGPKVEVVTNAGRYLSIIYAGVLYAQIHLALLQMKDASTPSTKSRISFYTIAVLSMGDGFTAMAFLPLGMFIETTFLNFLAVSFFAFLSVTFLDLRFLMDIWMVQDEERRRQERHTQSQSRSGATPPAATQTQQETQPAGTSTTPPAAAVVTPAGADALPLPVTARQAVSAGATPMMLPPDQDELAPPAAPANNDSPTRRFGALYTRFYAILLIIVFLSLHATSWPLSLRAAYTNLLAFLYLSPWVPQIYRNV
ncbi:MAG: hypothetical protein INR71_14740, partial [Terriglobus roseus]|nr:hypothetical protein [Terriglobus roseus]